MRKPIFLVLMQGLLAGGNARFDVLLAGGNVRFDVVVCRAHRAEAIVQ
jgi:hypothetical protein